MLSQAAAERSAGDAWVALAVVADAPDVAVRLVGKENVGPKVDLLRGALEASPEAGKTIKIHGGVDGDEHNMARRPVFLLSGLLTRGCCQGKYGIIMNDRFGCLNHHRRGTCGNSRTIRRPVIEQRVLSGLTDRLVSAEAVAEAVRAYHEELNRQNHERRGQTNADRHALAKVERAINGIMAAIEDGMYQPAMKVRMAELERQKAENPSASARHSSRPAGREPQHRRGLSPKDRSSCRRAGRQPSEAGGRNGYPLAHRRCGADARRTAG